MLSLTYMTEFVNQLGWYEFFDHVEGQIDR